MEEIPPALKTLLEKCFPTTKLTKCIISSGANPGDNVVGKMLSVKITTASGENHDLVVKASVPFRSQADMTWTQEEVLFSRLVTAIGFFYTELAFYQRIQPELKLETQNENFALPTPKIYFGQVGDERGDDDDCRSSCIILEDLRPQGYKMADKFKGLTLEEVTLVLEKIAKFHAASYVYLKRKQVKISDPKDPLATHIFNKLKTKGPEAINHKNFFRKVYFLMLELGREKKLISEKLYQKILTLTQSPQQVILATSAFARDEYFPVVIHGDIWVNNILFKYDPQGKPVDVKFIDFQQTRYASVFDELHYFLYTSTTTTFRNKNLDACLKFYHKKFHETLVSLGNNPNDQVISGFTLEAFLVGYRKYLRAAFCYNVIAIPFQLGMPPSSADSTDEASKADETTGGTEDDEESLFKFISKTFEDIVVSIMPATKNSPPALSRFAEFCQEMDSLGLF